MNRCHPIDRETLRLQASSGDRPLALWTYVLADAEQDVPGDWLSDLGAEEIAYCRNFRRAADRSSYAAAHALLRRALGQTLGVAPGALQFARDALGRPQLAAPAGHTIDFNLSHTDGLVAVAISRIGRVGVDVECVGRDRAALGALYADSTLHELRAFGLRDDEIADLAALPEALREPHFLDGWTLREAVAKADGRGVSMPFSAIAIDRQHLVATLSNSVNDVPQRWRLWRQAPTPRHRLALACADEGACLVNMAPLL